MNINCWEYQQMKRFLKKEKLYLGLVKANLSQNKAVNEFLNNVFHSSSSFSDMALDLTFLLGGFNISNSVLVTSQLWRFFLLEQLTERDPENEKMHVLHTDILKKTLIKDIKSNGKRGSKTIETLFEKYNLNT